MEYYVNPFCELLDREAEDESDKSVILVDGDDEQNIGEIGNKDNPIDINIIFKNIIAQNGAIAFHFLSGLGAEKYPLYAALVDTGCPWDLKNRDDLIFGLAWDNFDETGKQTYFKFDKFDNMVAPDVGNFHAGVTGIMAGFDHFSLLKGAGAAEILKRTIQGDFDNMTSRMMQFYFNVYPYGDEPKDAFFNLYGMKYGKKIIE